MKGLAFECSSGRVVKVHEAICWRHAEGRSCFPPHDGTRLPDVVVVPVAPNVHEREEGGKAGAEAPAGLDAAAAAAYNRYGGRIWGALERARTARPAPQVKDAAEQAMMDACGNVGNRDIEPFVPTLVGCILTPAKVADCIHGLASTTSGVDGGDGCHLPSSSAREHGLRPNYPDSGVRGQHRVHRVE